ncbi:CRISPR-associated endonuclease Cas2 [Candidatus Uhrbacteria bacterium]|nr:CRISPR-associated endonuclease Cas2 [Candidatus Uhrbacteria bacterium]
MEKKTARHLRQDSSVAKVLQTFGNFVYGFSYAQTFRGRKLLWYYEFDVERMRHDIPKRQKTEAIRLLRQRKLLQLRERAGKFEAAFTQEGFFEYTRLQVLSANTLPDGKDCLVVFDIPEQCRAIRRQWRNFLRASGFIQYQLSVWISPFDAAQPLTRLIHLAGVDRWIRVYIAELQCYVSDRTHSKTQRVQARA